jgi:predicted acylesterase/phospholipase RssA
MSTINSLTSPVIQPTEQVLERKTETINPVCPFEKIGLTLSGGGFRAAAFSLGAISYLNKTWYKDPQDSLLRHVNFLTSTSGGTITNAYYSACLFKPGFNFDSFYKEMKDFMQGDLVLKEALDILDDPAEWTEAGFRQIEVGGKLKKIHLSKSRNLINAFAKAYDRKLFNAANKPGENLYGIYFDRSQSPHLAAVCFNATELNNGISFRFQTNGDAQSIGTVGNYYLKFQDAETAKLLKISDMVAASSCFPSGFEPIIYPDDFIHQGLTDAGQMAKALHYENNNPLKLNEVAEQPFCLVDGGVVDNQGLYSLMMEDNFRAQYHPEKQFDLMMVCDVGSYFNDAFKVPVVTKSALGGLTVNKLRKLFPYGTLLFIVSALLLCLTTGILRNIGLLFILPTALYTFIYLYAVIKIGEVKADLANSSWGKMINRYVGKFYDLRFDRLQQMLSARITSTIEIATDLFLKQERRQYYSEFYNMPAYKNRTLSCFIYEFSLQHEPSRLENLNKKDKSWWPGHEQELQPSTMMQHIATEATAMDTTLWFNEDPDKKQTTRDHIIACGEFTMCYNLLKHIYRLEILDNKWVTDMQLQELKKRLTEDWNQFRKKTIFSE